MASIVIVSPEKFRHIFESLMFYEEGRIGSRYIVEFIPNDIDSMKVGDKLLGILNA